MSNLAESSISISQNQVAGRVSGHDNGFTLSVKKLNRILSLWINRYQQRKQLAQLEVHLLEDVGLTREQVEQEVSRPFWD